jgi:hypothetical protein
VPLAGLGREMSAPGRVREGNRQILEKPIPQIIESVTDSVIVEKNKKLANLCNSRNKNGKVRVIVKKIVTSVK